MRRVAEIRLSEFDPLRMRLTELASPLADDPFWKPTKLKGFRRRYTRDWHGLTRRLIDLHFHPFIDRRQCLGFEPGPEPDQICGVFGFPHGHRSEIGPGEGNELVRPQSVGKPGRDRQKQSISTEHAKSLLHLVKMGGCKLPDD